MNTKNYTGKLLVLVSRMSCTIDFQLRKTLKCFRLVRESFEVLGLLFVNVYCYKFVFYFRTEILVLRYLTTEASVQWIVILNAIELVSGH